MHVRFTADAEADLNHISAYLTPRSPKGLERILSAIFTTSAQLEDFPFIGRDGLIEGTRELIVPRTPFILVYRISDAYYVDILRIYHGRQTWPPNEES